MIKLIVTDMDGSLLNSQKQLPNDFFDILTELLEKGIEFAVASGRTYLTLLHHFDAVADKIHFLSDNGTNIYKYGKRIYTSEMHKASWQTVAKLCEGKQGVAAIINSEKKDYIHPSYKNNEELYNIVKGGFAALSENENYTEINERVYKIGICDVNGPQNGLYEAVSAICSDKLDAVISGPCYMDVMAKGENKGAALSRLQKELAISPQNTMAFGDFYNDVDMLKNAYYSYVMGNAPKDMQAYARFKAVSNNDCGVTKTIRRVVLEGGSPYV